MRRHDHLFKGTRKILTNSVVVTSGPITADAATAKVVGIKKSITVSASATNKVTGLSKAEKKIVKVTKKGKKFTIKGLKAGKATFKIGKKSYTVKVGATTVKAAKTKLTLTKGKAATLKFTTKSGNGDTLTFKASNKNVTLAKKSAKIAKSAASVKATAKKAGKTTITATSKATGKKATVTVTVKNPAKPATTTPGASNTPVATATGSATNTPEATATATATASGSATNTPDVTATPVATATGTATATPVATGSATSTPEATEVPTEAPTKAPEVVTGGTITVSGAAVSGASIKVVSGTTVVAEGTAKEAGFTTSTKLAAGTYTIVITKDGYDAYSTSAVVTDGENTVVNAELVKTAAPAIESVVADNLKTLKINFNTEIDKDDVSATTVKVYTGTNTVATTVDTDLTDGVAAGKVGYTVSTDKKTVTVVFGTVNTQDTKVKVVVDSLKTVSADKISGEKSVTVLDTTLPAVSDVKVDSSKKFYVYFSEPVQLTGSGSVKVWSDFVIDGKEFAGKVTQDDINSRLVFEPAEKLTSGTKTIEISGVKDYANLPIVKTSKTFTVLVDTAAPELKEVIAESYDELKLVFDEKLSTKGTVTLGTTDVTSHADIDADDAKILVVDLTAASKEFTTASLVEENTVTVKDQTDAEENKTAEKTVKFVVKDDTTAPTAAATVNTDNEVVVKFSERVDATAAGTAANYTVKDADGNKVTIANVSAYDAKTKSVTLRISGYNNTNGATYTVTIAKDVITDTSVRKNKMAEQKLSVTLKDNKKPEVSKIYGANGGNKVTVIFSEPMDTATLAQKGNYLFVDSSPAQTVSLNELTESVVTVKDSKTVELTLGKLNSNVVALASGDKIAFQNLKDQNGNVIAYGTSDTYTQDTFTAADVKSIEATGKKTLKVTLDDGVKFTQVAAKDFVLSKASGSYSALADTNMIVSDAKLSTDGTYVTLTLSKELETNGRFNDSSLTDLYVMTTDGTTKGNAATATKNEIGTSLQIAANAGIQVQDKIAASVKSVEAVSKTNCNQIKVTFDENISTKDAANFAALQYQIKVAVDGEELSFVKGDFAIEGVNSKLNADNFVITIKKNGVKSNNVTVALPDASVLTDGAAGTGNAVNTFTATAVKFTNPSFVTAEDKYIVEKTKPYLLASASQATNLAMSGKTFQVKFSEAMDKDTVENVENWTVGSSLSDKITISYNVTTKVATFTVDAASVSDNNTIVPKEDIKDLNGNAIDFATAGVGKTITIETDGDGVVTAASVTDATA